MNKESRGGKTLAEAPESALVGSPPFLFTFRKSANDMLLKDGPWVVPLRARLPSWRALISFKG